MEYNELREYVTGLELAGPVTVDTNIEAGTVTVTYKIVQPAPEADAADE